MVIHHIKAYFENYGVPPIIHVVQGDTLRTFVFDCGEALTEGSETASLFCKRPNESVYSYLGVVDHQTKEVTVVLDDAGGAFTQAGVVAAQLVIQDSGDAVRSFKFDVIVEGNFSGTPTPEDVSFLDGLQAQLDEWIEGAEAILNNFPVVSANPTVTTTNTALTSLQIGNDKYRCANPADVANNASAISTLSNTVSGINGSLISLQATVGGLTPTTGTGNIYSATEGTNIGTYTWYKLSKVVFVRIDTCTGTSIDMGYRLTNFPSTDFATTKGAFTYLHNQLSKCGYVSFYVDGNYVNMSSVTEDEWYAKSVANAIGTWFTIILN